MRYRGVPYYGKLVDIIKFNYNEIFTLAMFKCEWASMIHPRGIKANKFYFTFISFKSYMCWGAWTCSELQMVYYIDDQKESGWNIRVFLKPRDLYNIREGDEDTMVTNEAYHRKIQTIYSLTKILIRS